MEKLDDMDIDLNETTNDQIGYAFPIIIIINRKISTACMRRFVNRLKRVIGRLTTLYKPRPWWLKKWGKEESEGKKKKKGKASEEARMGEGCRARQRRWWPAEITSKVKEKKRKRAKGRSWSGVCQMPLHKEKVVSSNPPKPNSFGNQIL